MSDNDECKAIKATWSPMDRRRIDLIERIRAVTKIGFERGQYSGLWMLRGHPESCDDMQSMITCFATKAWRYLDDEKLIPYQNPNEDTEDTICHFWMSDDIDGEAAFDLLSMLCALLYRPWYVDSGPYEATVDAHFGWMRLQLYGHVRMSYGQGYDALGSPIDWYPADAEETYGVAFDRCVSTLPESLDGRPYRPLACHTVSVMFREIGDIVKWKRSFISATLWSVISLWLTAYRVSTGGVMDANALLRRSNSPCQQWADAVPDVPIPEADRHNASALDLIMGFAGVHYNYAKVVAGAALLPRAERVSCDGITRNGLLESKFVIASVRDIDASRVKSKGMKRRFCD